MMWGYHDFPGWWMVFGGFGMVLFWGAVVWISLLVFRSVSSEPRHHAANMDDAEAIARRRFAAGEISEEEYRHIIRSLQR